MDVRLPGPAGGRPRSAIVAVVVGGVLLVAPVAAVASQGLDAYDRLNALMLALAGLVVLGWGARRLAVTPGRLQYAIEVHLDGVGVTVRGPEVSALIAWPDVALVEVRWWQVVPPYVEEAVHLPVLRFVARHDGDITLAGTPAISADLAHAFGISRPAAALTAVIGTAAVEPLEDLLAWVGAHRPDVPVEVGAPPVL